MLDAGEAVGHWPEPSADLRRQLDDDPELLAHATLPGDEGDRVQHGSACRGAHALDLD